MNRYLAKLASLEEKSACCSNPQNPQNHLKKSFERFEGPPRGALQSATPPTESSAGNDGSALAALRPECPAHVPEDRWQQAVADATAFISEWGAQAQAFGWTADELFGLHPVPEQPAANYDRLARVDHLGLIWLLHGRPVIALTATEAVIRCASGAKLVCRRQNKSAGAAISDVDANE